MNMPQIPKMPIDEGSGGSVKFHIKLSVVNFVLTAALFVSSIALGWAWDTSNRETKLETAQNVYFQQLDQHLTEIDHRLDIIQQNRTGDPQP